MFDKKIEIVLDDTAMKNCEAVLNVVNQIYLEMFNHEHKTGKKVVLKTATPYDISPEEFSSEMVENAWNLIEELSGICGCSMEYTIEEKEENENG